MKRQSVARLTILCGILLCVIAPFDGPRAHAQNPPAQGNSGGGTAPMSGDASGKHAAQEPKAAGQKASGQKLAEEQFKNIQVLKGIPADQLIPAMQFITASLGVDCEYCHDHQAMDGDDKKPKKIARQMMTMMFDIDKNNFDGRLEVTCYTCHRGAAKPVNIPVIKDEEKGGFGAAGKKPAENAALPKPEELLDKYLAALGGAAAVEKITSRVQKGKVMTFDGQSFPAEVYSKAPDKRVSIMHLKDGDSVTAFDGQRGWMSVPGRPAHMMSASENESARLDADLYFPVHVKTLYSKFTVKSGEKIDGHDTYLVEGREEGRPPLRLYFDTQTGLLLRLVRYAQTPLGLNPTQIDYADYREADGVKVLFRWTVSRPGNRFTILVEEMKQNVPVEDAKFTTPPPPPAQLPGNPSGGGSTLPPSGQKPPSRK
ncbi:MAG: photosynthetic reaction center cytochrome c subunit [Acidobacteriaceae bacterium]|jgi:outer membrane lipoprotein-sorting protein|nr:photosynthetic reaction center cytochrome c subunit [Acidobacteriaceae bacterium]